MVKSVILITEIWNCRVQFIVLKYTQKCRMVKRIYTQLVTLQRQ